jgi:hypothetical protein
MARHASLDPHSLNQKIENVKNQITAELDELESRFEDLYNMMHDMKEGAKTKTVKTTKKKKKVAVEKV